MRDAAAVVGELILDDSVGEAALRTARAGRYRVIRPFLVLLAQALPLVTAPARQKILVPRTVRETAALKLSDTPASQHVFQAVAACREGGTGNDGPVSTATASSFLNAAGPMGG